MSDSPTRRTRLGAAAGLLGAATAFTFILGAGPAPSVFQLAGVNEDISGNCDEAEHADDPECIGVGGGTGGGSTSSTIDDSSSSSTSSTSSTIDDSSSSTTAPTGPTTPPASVRSIDAAGAGTVLVAVEGGSLRLVAATPTSGWRVEVEQAAGREVEVDFRSGSKRVQVNVELEDGQVRERVRVRDDADGTDTRTEDGVVVRDDSRDDDSSGHGSGGDDSRDDDDDDDDDRSGHGGGDDDDDRDDDDSSGHGGDDD